MPSSARLSAPLALLLAVLATALVAQSPAPAGDIGEATVANPPLWLERGRRLLDVEDPVGAWRVFQVADEGPRARWSVERQLGLGSSHLMLGRGQIAVAYGERALAAAPGRQDGMALLVRALIRDRQFDDAVVRAHVFVARSASPSAELLAARGSALFRVQRTSEAADAYRRVVALDRDNAEAHLRLGSGLLDPVRVTIPLELQRAVAWLADGDLARAAALLHQVLTQHPGHPIAHRLLGETLFALRLADSMAAQDDAFRELQRELPVPYVGGLPLRDFVSGYEHLVERRRVVVARVAAAFRSRLDKLVTVGGRHDLLLELERTTDAECRSSQRGQRTFDGRVWDDVRGIGGLRAATGIEALDEAATFGFDTFAHEVAHQVHFYTFSPLERARVRSLYRQAMARRCCLDYYAASNEAEYFAQGVEAFLSLAKRPGGETTHGHTRFELKRVDPALYDFVDGLVDHDPLDDERHRDGLLAAAIRVALRCGRVDDAEVAVAMMAPGRARDRLERDVERAGDELRSY